MLPSFSVPDLKKIELNTELTVEPDVTVAFIETYYNQLLSTWEIGEQIATLQGQPVSRTYSELGFNNDAESLELVDLGFVSQEYEGRYYYRVVHKFYEDEYYSSTSKEHGNFSKWEKSHNTYLQEIIYKHAVRGNIRWERPYTVVSCAANTSNTSSNSIESVLNSNTTEICTPLPAIAPTSTSTGRGTAVTKKLGNPLTATSIQWNAISIPFKRTVAVGEALGAIITCDRDFIVRLKSTLEDEGEEVEVVQGSPILLTKPYMEVEIKEPTQYLPTFININFYGVELWRSFAPISIDEEPDILIHPTATTQSNKYKPPGKNKFPDNFWNSNPNLEKYENYTTRQGVNPSWV